MKLEIHLIWPGCAQGKYVVKARGCILAVLFWGSDDGLLAGWGPFAYVPVDPAGNGTFAFGGRRGIPPDATHVWARCYAADFASSQMICAVIPGRYLPADAPGEPVQRFSVLTDLHLSAKPWKIRQALRAAQSDTVFLLGDLTNDGLPEQFDAFAGCIREEAPDKILLPVTGNHDVLRGQRPDGCRHYEAFQKTLLDRAAERGCAAEYAPDGRAYAVRIGGLDVIGLQCVAAGRQFRFPDQIQPDWLERRLSAAQNHIILCHAPLLKHNPSRNEGVPYLDQNRRLQELVDRTGGILFLNGHTHMSPNTLRGNAEHDEAHRNL